jgi:hypothetical protein
VILALPVLPRAPRAILFRGFFARARPSFLHDDACRACPSSPLPTPRVSWPRARQRPGQYRGMPFTELWAHTVPCMRA